MTTTAARFADIRDKVYAGARLTAADGLFLDRKARSIPFTETYAAVMALRFLGEVSEEQIPLIQDALRVACAGRGALSLQLGALGAFPRLARPEIVWVGLDCLAGDLAGVQQGIEAAAVLVGLGAGWGVQAGLRHSELGLRDLPQAPVEDAQGSLELLWQIQRWMQVITGLPGVTTQPVAGAQGELVGLKLFQAYHRHHGQGHRDILLIPSTAHGTNFATATTAGYGAAISGRNAGRPVIAVGQLTMCSRADR